MFDLQTLIAVLATLLLFLTSVVLSYDKLQFRNYDLPIPQWAGLSLAGITFSLLVADQILRGLVRFEEEQRRVREENFRIEERNRRLEETERQTRRTRIETRYRIALIQYQLDPSSLHRRELGDILALLQEYQDTL
ncbi:MAG: hypothetical protein ACK5CA_12925 [Cyanobacteriota bacterium]|jgi:hypothetical protein